MYIYTKYIYSIMHLFVIFRHSSLGDPWVIVGWSLGFGPWLIRKCSVIELLRDCN